ncbi:MAG: LysR family transcriptional regulator [bacterium]
MSLIHPGVEAFVAVVRCSTVHGAAQELGLTQTAVTQRIRGLERRLETTLFTRSRRGMRLTPEGEALNRYCQSVIDLEGELLSQLGAALGPATLRLCIVGPSSMMRSRIIPAASAILADHENVVFTFHLDDDLSGLPALKNGAAQLAVLPRAEVVNELDSKLLRPARYILVGPVAWSGRELRDVVRQERIVDFNEADDATHRYLERHRLLRHARRDRHLANNTDALAALVAAGHGYSVLSEDFAQPLLAGGQLIDLNPGKHLRIDFALAWYPRHAMPAYFASLIEEIQ